MIRKQFSSARLAVLLTVPLFISACGGGGDDASTSSELDGLTGNDMPVDTVTAVNPWLVSIRTFRLASQTPGSGDARIATYQNSGTTTVQDYIDFYDAQVELDTCEINSDVDDNGGDDSGGDELPFVTAGESVVINAPNGPWYTITESEVGRYAVNNELPGAIPDGATLSIPGAVFPSVSAIPLREPATPVRLLPEPGSVNAASEYSWVPGDGSDGQYIRLSFLEYDDVGNFIDFRIGCDLVDDGAFELPIDVQFSISNNPNFIEARYTRRLMRVAVVEGAVVYTRTSVAE